MVVNQTKPLSCLAGYYRGRDDGPLICLYVGRLNV